MAEVKQASASNLTAHVRAAINVNAYLAVTCHHINDQLEVGHCSGIQNFPLSCVPCRLHLVWLFFRFLYQGLGVYWCQHV